MNKKITLNRKHNSRYTIVENKRNSINSFKKSKTRINQLKPKMQIRRPESLTTNIPKQSKKEEPADVENIFQDIVQRINAKQDSGEKKLHIDHKGVAKVVTVGKDNEPSRSKLGLFSGSLINHYWAGESVVSKGRFSKFEEYTLSERVPMEVRPSIREKMAKTSQKAKDLVGITKLRNKRVKMVEEHKKNNLFLTGVKYYQESTSLCRQMLN